MFEKIEVIVSWNFLQEYNLQNLVVRRSFVIMAPFLYLWAWLCVYKMIYLGGRAVNVCMEEQALLGCVCYWTTNPVDIL